ncbi:unnamed protein product [Lymnaea stagnalis]|uniref:RNA polymerase I-specific transcription initiation factor RRN3 n=1 Tax=Lymnaea stagnalis TaxID=6523 RepID=A0AAV2HNH5_LYMST
MDCNMPSQLDFYTDIKVVLQGYNNANEASGNVYDILLKTLSNPDIEPDTIIHILEDLEQVITLLTQEHKALINVILNLKWLDKGPKMTAAYQAFILNFLSAHMFYLKPIIRMLIKKFVPDINKGSETENQEAVILKTEQDLSHIHELLKSLSQLVPTTSILIVQMLEEHFPYLNKSTTHFEYYTRGVLAVSTYMPSLRLELLELVVKNMLKLDVRSSRLDINTVICVPEEPEEMEDTIFEMASLKKNSRAPSPKLVPVAERLASALPLAGSLDAMMTLTFQYIREICFVKDKLDWDVTKKLYREFLSIFDKFIFPTHASCHVQFLLFYICSFREALAEGFIDYLWKKVTEPSIQSIYRQTAACFIGSFLTRATYISVNIAKEVMELMMKWLHQYLDQTVEQGLHADIAHHGTFYSVCQSAFYIFCFKHNDFMQLKKGQKWAESLNFQRIVTSKLNPLRVCIPIIVRTFASATRMHQLAFCDTIIERNNRYSLPLTSSSYSIDLPGSKQLESYFPFDPYLLPRSISHVASLYFEFRGSLPDEDEEDNEDIDDFLPDEDDDKEVIPDPLSKSPADFLQYGISPGFTNG